MGLMGRMDSAFSPLADGTPGVAQIVATLAQLKTHFGRLPAIRAAALAIVNGAGHHDQAAQINALARFVREGVVYINDPLNLEYIQTPDVMLLTINREGRAYGDCDDHALLFAALAEAIGIPTQIVAVATRPGGIPDHVIVIAQLDGGPLEFDLIAKGVIQPSYGDRMVAPGGI